MFMISLLGHRKILVTLIGVDSAALTAAVALPGKAILIFRNGLMKYQNQKQKYSHIVVHVKHLVNSGDCIKGEHVIYK